MDLTIPPGCRNTAPARAVAAGGIVPVRCPSLPVSSPDQTSNNGRRVENLFQVILLGIIEGVTEFLPISSTGHLLIAQHWLGRRSDLFTVAIQAGAILAVTLVYWRRLLDMVVGFTRPENRDYLLKLALALIVTVIGGLSARLAGIELPESVYPVAAALIIGGFVIFAAESYVSKHAPNATISWQAAAWVGVAQVIAAVFPGTSRSAAALFAAMLAGTTSRPAAAEFAFLLAIPTMFAATAYQVMDLYFEGGLATEPWADLGVAFIVSTIVGFIAVKWLLRYIQSHSYVPFAWYRIGLGVLLLAVI